MESTCKDIPIIVGGEEIRNENVRYQVSPYNHSQKIAKYYWADKDLLTKAADAAVAAQVTGWICSKANKKFSTNGNIALSETEFKSSSKHPK